MQTPCVEQILFGIFAGAAVLWMAGTKPCDDSWSIPYGSIFILELWGLSKPDASSFMDWDAFFPDLFYLGKGAQGDDPYRCRTHVPEAVCAGTERCRPCGDGDGLSGLFGGGSRLLCQIFWLRPPGAAASGTGHPAAGFGVRPGERMAAGTVSGLDALYMDAGADPLYVFAASRLFGDLERKLFPPVSFDARNVGSGIFPAVVNPVRPGDPAFPRNRIAPCVPAKIAFLHQNFTFV